MKRTYSGLLFGSEHRKTRPTGFSFLHACRSFGPKGSKRLKRHWTMSGNLVCKHCHRDNFKSSRALTQHQLQSRECAQKAKEAVLGAQKTAAVTHVSMVFAPVSYPKGLSSVNLPASKKHIYPFCTARTPYPLISTYLGAKGVRQGQWPHRLVPSQNLLPNLTKVYGTTTQTFRRMFSNVNAKMSKTQAVIATYFVRNKETVVPKRNKKSRKCA